MKPYGIVSKFKTKTRWIRKFGPFKNPCTCFLCKSRPKYSKNKARESGKKEIRKYVR